MSAMTTFDNEYAADNGVIADESSEHHKLPRYNTCQFSGLELKDQFEEICDTCPEIRAMFEGILDNPSGFCIFFPRPEVDIFDTEDELLKVSFHCENTDKEKSQIFFEIQFLILPDGFLAKNRISTSIDKTTGGYKSDHEDISRYNYVFINEEDAVMYFMDSLIVLPCISILDDIVSRGLTGPYDKVKLLALLEIKRMKQME